MLFLPCWYRSWGLHKSLTCFYLPCVFLMRVTPWKYSISLHRICVALSSHSSHSFFRHTVYVAPSPQQKSNDKGGMKAVGDEPVDWSKKKKRCILLPMCTLLLSLPSHGLCNLRSLSVLCDTKYRQCPLVLFNIISDVGLEVLAQNLFSSSSPNLLVESFTLRL